MAGLSYRQKPRAVESQPVPLTLPTSQCQANNRQGGLPLEGTLHGAKGMERRLTRDGQPLGLFYL